MHDEDLRLENHRHIYEYVERNPGAHLRRISRDIDMHLSTLRYHIDYLEDVLCVPVQALVQRGDETWCYVAENNRPVRRSVTAGQTNDKFVEITSGLSEGDQVVLNPSAILEGDDEVQAKEIASDRENTTDLSVQ